MFEKIMRVISALVTVAILIVIYQSYKKSGGGIGDLLSPKSNYKVAESPTTTFNDVKGCEDAKGFFLSFVILISCF